MKPKFKVIDQATGEILDAVSLTKIKQPIQQQESFYMGYQSKEFWLYTDKTITKGELKVYGLFKCVMDYKNEIDYTQTDMARELKMDYSDVNKAINSLIKRGVIEKVIHKGRYFTYRMCDDYARKGNQISRVK